MLRWHLQQKLLKQDHAASFGSFLWQSYLPNGVAAKGICNAVMLGVNVAPIYHRDRESTQPEVVAMFVQK